MNHAVIENIFLREIDSEDGSIEVVRAEGAAFVSVYTGPIVWQIELRDLSAVIRLIGYVLNTPDGAAMPIPLACGTALSVGIGAEGTHLWISASVGHMRLRTNTANALLAALSDARAHIAHGAQACVQPDRRPARC